MYVIDVSNQIFTSMYSPSQAKFNRFSFPTQGLGSLVSKINQINKKKAKDEKIYFVQDGRDNFRKKLYPDYKVNRKNNPEKEVYKEMFSLQVEQVEKLFPNFGIEIVKHDFLEADDLIYSLAYLNQNEKCEVYSDDSDLTAIHLFNSNPKTKIHSLKGKGVIPFQDTILLDKILKGDVSDNIPNLKLPTILINHIYSLIYNKKINLYQLKDKKVVEAILQNSYPQYLESLYLNAHLVLPIILNEEILEASTKHGEYNFDNSGQILKMFGMKKLGKSFGVDIESIKYQEGTAKYAETMFKNIPKSVTDYFKECEFTGNPDETYVDKVSNSMTDFLTKLKG